MSVKAVIPFAIGIVSVTAAVAGWQAARYDQRSTDRDRQLIVDTAFLQRRDAAVEGQLQSETNAFARYRAEVAAQRQLVRDAEKLRAQGLAELAADAENEAVLRRQLADNLASLNFLSSYVKDDEQEMPVFDVTARRVDLTRQHQGDVAEPDLRRTAAEADAFSDRSQRLVGWIVAFAAAVLALTAAEVSRSRRVQLALAGLGSGGFVIAAALAFLGNSA